MHLPASLAAWRTPAFEATLKQELRAQAGALPLQQALAATSIALDHDIQVMVMRAADAGASIEVDVGVFYAGLVAGCSCANDPTPVEPQNEYCELRVSIDKGSAAASARPRNST
jgi:hypothetical protein